MARQQDEGGSKKKLTADDYRKIANSTASQNIPNIANWLPQKIQQIHHLYLELQEKNLDAIPVNIPEEVWHELDKIRGHLNHPAKQNSFLNSMNVEVNEHYRACCNLVAKTVYLLEKIMSDAIDAWRKPERFLNRSKPTECLIKKINNQTDYELIQMIALTLKEIYQQYPDQNEILFPYKKMLAPFVENIKSEPERTHRYREE